MTKKLGHLTKIFGLFLTITSLYSCVTYNLEKKLNTKLREWYSIHSILMQTRLPNGQIEAVYFLHLPENMQIAYIRMFWKIRFTLLDQDKEFEARVGWANRIFGGEKVGKG